MSGQTSFIRSIRVRYLSGLLILAVACAAIIFAIERANSFRHEIDAMASDFAALAQDVRRAEAFAGQATSNWRQDTRGELASAALGHVERLNSAVKDLEARIAAIMPTVLEWRERGFRPGDQPNQLESGLQPTHGLRFEVRGGNASARGDARR